MSLTPTLNPSSNNYTMNDTVDYHQVTGTADGSNKTFVNTHCELRKLARVEIQSIMQFLPRLELLRLSRCSRTLLADGDTDTAWRTQPNYSLLVTPTTATFLIDHDPSLLRHSSILWRHQPGFSIIFENDTPDAASHLSCKFILSILDTIPRIRVVSFPYALFSTEAWIAILQHSSLDELDEWHSGPTLCSFQEIITPFQRILSLKALSHPYMITKDNLDVLIAMPNLHTISFTDSQTWVDEVNSHGKPFARLPVSSTLVKFQQLTNVRIRHFQMSSNEFLTTFTAPQLCQLKELHLQDWELEGRPAIYSGKLTSKTREDLSVAFKSLKQLSHLSLILVPGIDEILPLLLPLTPLQQLILGYTASGYLSLMPMPMSTPLRHLLTHLLELVIHLRVYQLRVPRHPFSDYESLSRESNGRFNLTPLFLCQLCEVEVRTWSCQECDLRLCYRCDGDVHRPQKLVHHRRTKPTGPDC